MGFKKYILASIVFIVAIAVYIGAMVQTDYTLNIETFGVFETYKLTLPVFIWVILPVFVLFIASVLHMAFYGAKGYFERNSIQKDLTKVISVISSRLLKKDSSVVFKTPELKEFNNILNQVNIELSKDTISTESSEIKKAVETLNKIKNHDYIPAKELKLASDNELVKENVKNRIINDSNFAIEVLKSASNYDQETVELAFKESIENKSVATIKKAIEGVALTSAMVKELLIKDSKAANEMAFTNPEILQLIQDNKFTNSELMEVAKNYKRTMSPEQLIKLFEDISSGNEKLTGAYLYVLFEYEMIDDVRGILVNSQKDEFIVFKAMLDLRDAGKHYTLDTLTFDS